MRKTVLVVPGWLSPEGDESALRSSLPFLDRLASMGSVERSASVPSDAADEIAYLGLNPTEFAIAQGPLIAAALGADPPPRSVQYQVDLMSIQDGIVLGATEVSREEIASIWAESQRLHTKRVTLLGSDRLQGAMVLEDGSPEMRILSPNQIGGKPLSEILPEAEDEAILRRLIDDSINMLDELELNARRVDEGKPPINLLWPWGGGFRPSFPNLALRFGQTVRIESSSIRLQGLARLVGWKHGDPDAMGRGTAIRLEYLLECARSNPVSIAFIDSISEFRREGKFEEIEWLTREIDRRFFAPIAEDIQDGESSLLILATGLSNGPGLSLFAAKGVATEKPMPFDERALDEQTIKMNDVWERVAAYLRWNPNS